MAAILACKEGFLTMKTVDKYAASFWSLIRILIICFWVKFRWFQTEESCGITSWFLHFWATSLQPQVVCRPSVRL